MERKKSMRVNQRELAREFCEGTGYSTPDQAIAAGVKTIEDWSSLVFEHREAREANPLPRGAGFRKSVEQGSKQQT